MDIQTAVSRRDFLVRSGVAAASGLISFSWPALALGPAAAVRRPARYEPIIDNLPARPKEKPLPWRTLADAFRAFVMAPENGILLSRKDGSPCFASATESKGDGGLTTMGPILVGLILRGEDPMWLPASLAAYFNESAGIFLDGVGAQRIEYWYMMNVNALAVAVIKSGMGQDPVWLKRLQRSADRLIAMAHQVKYNYNEQGYDFATNSPWTNKDIYRQPDAVAGYAYLMLFAYERLGDSKYLAEAKTALGRYLGFRENPWYEIPSGAMACLAAARLSAHHGDPESNLHKALNSALDPKIGCLRTGEWGGREVNGLMGGWRTEPPGQAYSMESMVALLYILPVLRYDPRYATDIGKYALNAAANMRWFYSEYLPNNLQSKPDFAPAVPYERLSQELNGRSPFAAGDYDGQRSVYGGAYALWLGELIKPTQDDYILQLDVAKTDFLANATYPTFLYYNPWPEERKAGVDLGKSKADVYDTLEHRYLRKNADGQMQLAIPGAGSRVVVVIPSGVKRGIEHGVLTAGGVPVDYFAGGAR